MTRSVEELRRESERSRAELSTTLDQLSARIADTAEDLRHKVSPQHVKAEVSDFIGNTTRGWLDGLKRQAMNNPMQAVAAGSAIAVPLLRLARGFPLPLFMIGAGLALTSKTVRDSASEAAAPAMGKARDMIADATERAQSLRGSADDAVAWAQAQSTDTANQARDAVAGVTDQVSAEYAITTVSDKLKGGLAAAKEKLEQARSTVASTAASAKDAAAAAPVMAGQAIGENAALITGLGVAIGALIAAALPATNAEAKLMGGASTRLKRSAEEAAQSGVETAQNAVKSAADAAAKSVANADLSGHASRMTKNLTDTVKDIADDVVTVALNPSRNPTAERSSHE
jgi:F0F1-type ATP synthase membrane subunit b/b'